MTLAIDVGIDLGTTNSAIARQRGAAPELLAGDDGDPLLPSAVHIDAAGRMTLGRPALARLVDDAANTAVEFKRSMGTNARIAFPTSGQSFSPEELSAKILEALLRRATGHGEPPLRAAVITVPAMFQLPQSEATRKAAALAGLEHAPLIQEPIAAAIAYAGTGSVQDGNWLVYDLGGGTFDVSLVRSRGGRLQVLDHDGDNHLGGKDLNRVLARRAADQVRAEGRLGAFGRTDPAMAAAFTQLTVAAESARIRLSDVEQTELVVEQLARDPGGQWVGLRMSLDRQLLAEILRPLLLRTVELCRKLIDRNQLSTRQLHGIVLVGGPTRTPFLAGLLETELGVRAAHVGDPTTIVAAGAALFASTQKLPPTLRRRAADAPADEIGLQLEFESMTTNLRPLLVGQAEGRTSDGPCAVQVVGSDGGFDSGRVPLNGTRGFSLSLALQKGRLNAFELRFWDGERRRPTNPATFTVLHGTSIGKPPLSQSVGVMLADNSTCWYLRKGQMLPARKTVTHATTQSLRRGQSGDAIHVPLVQGENERADRNKIIGVLHIRAESLPRDLPAGSEVEVTLSVDEFSNTIARAYVPLLNTWFNDVVAFQMEVKERDEVQRGLSEQHGRLEALEQMAGELDGKPVSSINGRLREIEDLIAEGDGDSVQLAEQLVRIATAEIDEAERHADQRKLTDELESSIESAREVILVHGTDAEKRQLESLAHEYREAVAHHDQVVARGKKERIQELKFTVLYRTNDFWETMLSYVYNQLKTAGLLELANSDIEDAVRAIQNQDRQAMIAAYMKLYERLPREERDDIPSPSVVIRSQIT